jgi:hypothetical protein
MSHRQRRALGITIAASALTVASLGMLATPGLASTIGVHPYTVENTTCVEINYVLSGSTGNSSVTVLGDYCSSGPVKVRADEECQYDGSLLTVSAYGPAVTTGTSRANCTADGTNGILFGGWQYYKSGAWHDGSRGANT